MVIQRGAIYWADLGAVASRAPAKRRPVLVVQSDAFNRSRLGTVVVVAITSNTDLAAYPGNVFLPATLSNLPRDSVVNVTALATLDREDLDERIGKVPGTLMSDVNAGMRLALAL